MCSNVDIFQRVGLSIVKNGRFAGPHDQLVAAIKGHPPRVQPAVHNLAMRIRFPLQKRTKAQKRSDVMKVMEVLGGG